MWLCLQNNIEGIKLLLKRNPNMNLTNGHGETVLDIALRLKSTIIVSLLCGENLIV